MRQYTVTQYEDKDYQDFKNNLTNEYAIKLLEHISRGWIPDYNFDGSESDFYNYCLNMAIDRAIDALTERSKGE